MSSTARLACASIYTSAGAQHHIRVGPVLRNCRDSIMPERIECVNDRSPLIAEEQRGRNNLFGSGRVGGWYDHLARATWDAGWTAATG